jgi:hypothetical protein
MSSFEAEVLISPSAEAILVTAASFNSSNFSTLLTSTFKISAVSLKVI